MPKKMHLEIHLIFHRSKWKLSENGPHVTFKDDPPAHSFPGPIKRSGKHVGEVISVYWPIEQQYYAGVKASYDAEKMEHRIVYDDGSVKDIVLHEETWHFGRSDAADLGEEPEEENNDTAQPDESA